MKKGFILLITFLGVASNLFSQDNQDSKKLTSQDTEISPAKKLFESRTNSNQFVSNSDINKTNTNDVFKTLQGRISGAIAFTSTNYDGSSKVLLRGITSLVGDNNPLVIVDGIPMDNSNFNSLNILSNGVVDYGNLLNNIDENEIEDIAILKGASAAFYGSVANNGVIVITTKSAKKGKKLFQVDYNSSVDFSQISVMPQLQTKYGGGQIVDDIDGGVNGFNQININSETYLTPSYWIDESWGPKFDSNIQVVHWWGAEDYINGTTSTPETAPWVYNDGPETFWKTGKTYKNSISVAKSDSKYGVRFNYTNTYTDGALPNFSLMNHSFNLSGTFNITKKLIFSSNINYKLKSTEGRPTIGYAKNSLGIQFFQWGFNGLDYSKLKNYKNSDGTQRTWNRTSFDNSTPKYCNNPYWIVNQNYPEESKDRFFGYANLNYQLNDNFSIKTSISYDSYTFTRDERNSLGSVDLTSYCQSEITKNDYIIESSLNFSQKFNEFELNGVAGANYRNYKNSFNLGAIQYYDPFNISEDYANSYFLGFNDIYEFYSAFAFVKSNYKNFLGIDISARNDWLGEDYYDQKSSYSLGIDANFTLTELIKVPVFDLINFRAGYSTFNKFSFYNANSIVREYFGLVMSNRHLDMEKTSMFEVGTDLSFLENRLFLSGSYFNKSTENGICMIAVSPMVGYNYTLKNLSEVSSKGWDISFSGIPVKSQLFEWNFSVNFSKVKMYVDDSDGDVSQFIIGGGPFTGANIIAIIGDEYGQLWGFDYVYDDNGNKVISDDGYYVRTQQRVPLGSIYPDFNIGVNNKFRYKNFDIGFLFDIQKGGKFSSLTHMWGMVTGMLAETAGTNDKGNEIRDAVEDGGGVLLEGVTGDVTFNDDGTYTVTNTAENTKYISASDWASHFYGFLSPTKENVFDADYIKLREVSLGYTINKPFTNNLVKQIKVTLYGRNLATWGLAKKGFDPEMAVYGSGNIQGIENSLLPTFRYYGFNLQFQF